MLAGGIAHDFNNVLSVINGYAQILMEMNGDNARMVEPLKQIYAAGRRAANLTRQLLVFSRRQTMNEQIVDLNATIEDLAKMLARLIGERVKIDLDLNAGLPRTRADASMMEQIIVNLAVNARDAMPDGGKLTIGTSHALLPAEQVRRPQAQAGDYVRITVRDTGCGISPENLARIFEPFFTTKPTGQGTGLGLATVHAIVQQHHGWVDVASVVGQGTTFDVFLPAIAVTHNGHTPAAAVATRGGNETILLVEDEAAVRACAAEVLERYGYRVMQAGTATEAVDLWQRYESDIDLLLTDVVLPDHLTGFKLAETLRAGRPRLRVIVASGYPNDANPQAIERNPGTRFIYKPYDVLTLTRTVREVLDLTV
jgi:CheY-like chemotaxis protein